MRMRMRTMRAAGLAVAWLMTGLPVAAQEDPEMEMQRCVWRCLADSPGAASAQYNACVQRLCVAQPAPAQPVPVQPVAPAQSAAPVWSGGTTADGLGSYAATSDRASSSTLYLICAPGRERYLMLVGSAGPSTMLDVVIDGIAHSLWFAEQGGGHYATLPAGSPVVAALMRGRMVEIVNPAGYRAGTFSLAGAAGPISAALARCG